MELRRGGSLAEGEPGHTTGHGASAGGTQFGCRFSRRTWYTRHFALTFGWELLIILQRLMVRCYGNMVRLYAYGLQDMPEWECRGMPRKQRQFIIELFDPVERLENGTTVAA